MREFVNRKYNTSISGSPLEYGEENKNIDRGMFGTYFINRLPYYAIFPFEDGEIRVVERDGVLSDSGQIGEINYMLGDYLSKVTGHEITYVEILTVSGGGNSYDTKIARFIQDKFNQLITEENIGEFFSGICETEGTSLMIYMPETENSQEVLSDVTKKLTVFAEPETVQEIVIYTYSGELKIQKYEIGGKYTDFKNYPTIFDYYYVINPYEEYYFKENPTDNDFVLRAEMMLDRGYSSGHGQCVNERQMNGWIVAECDESVFFTE
ncbi:MAG: hypothetical protein IJZ51_01420 [Ruminiclostridium sp.]|nr:hypothetical protein [Ruminiclostridium sp.]